MARSRFLIGLAVLTSLAASSAAVAQQATISVPSGQVHRLSVRGQANAVIVGNPLIADVTVVDSHTLYVTGKAIGTTEVVVVDAAGRVLNQSLVNVPAPALALREARVWRGNQATNMICDANGCAAVSAANNAGLLAGGN